MKIHVYRRPIIALFITVKNYKQTKGSSTRILINSGILLQCNTIQQQKGTNQYINMNEFQKHYVKRQKSITKGTCHICRWNQRIGNTKMMEIRTLGALGASGLEKRTRELSEVKRIFYISFWVLVTWVYVNVKIIQIEHFRSMHFL